MQKFKTILKKPFTIFLLIALLLFGSYQLGLYIDRPRDLGPEIQYIGKINHGCGGWLVYIATLFMCASPPNDYRYYFGTDIDEKNIKDYFKKAQYSEYKSKKYNSQIFDANGDNEFYLNYMSESAKQEVNEVHGITIDKRYLIEINARDYKEIVNAYE